MLSQISNGYTAFISDQQNRRFLHILLLGILLRVVIMPFFCHMDALSEARRVYFWAENNMFFSNIPRNTTMFIEVVFFHLTRFLLPNDVSMFFIEDIRLSTANIPHYFEFVSNFTIFRTLFILKLPYLVFDILTAIVLFHYFRDKDMGIRSCTLWLFNPITLFAFYVFGRFESIPIFFIAASLLAMKKKRIILAAVLVGLCLNGREMMVLYSPVFICTVLFASLKEIDLRKKIISIFIVSMFTIIALQLYSFLLNSGGGDTALIIKEGRVKHLFAYSLHRIMFIPFCYTLILLWISSSDISPHRKFTLGSGLAMMTFFAFSTHSAHFTSWMIIFPALFYGCNQKILMPFCALCIAWFVHWICITDLGVFTLWLASPYSLHFIGFPNVPVYLDKLSSKLGFFDRYMIIYLARTVFVATLIFMAGMMVRLTLKTHNEKIS